MQDHKDSTELAKAAETAQRNAAKQQAFRQRKRAANQLEVRGLFAHPDESHSRHRNHGWRCCHQLDAAGQMNIRELQRQD